MRNRFPAVVSNSSSLETNDLHRQISTSADSQRGPLNHQHLTALVGDQPPPPDADQPGSQNGAGDSAQNPLIVDLSTNPVPVKSKKTHEIYYYLITKIREKDKYERWHDFTLNKTSLANIFKKAISHTPVKETENLLRIRFELESHSSEMSYEISEDDEDGFEEMKEEFARIVLKELKEKKNEDMYGASLEKGPVFRILMRPVTERIVKQELELLSNEVEEEIYVDI